MSLVFIHGLLSREDSMKFMSASDGNGAYQNDESYNKYSDSGRGKLVCDFVIGGNTSRQPAGSSLRTNNYSPTGYLNKKGVVPGYNVRTSLYNPPFYPWPVIRLAVLYLGYAEACVECNDLNTAKTYLDKVRTRAGYTYGRNIMEWHCYVGSGQTA